MHISIYTLGSAFIVIDRGQDDVLSFSYSHKKALGILYLLASSPTKSLIVAHICEILWNWMDSRSAEANFFANLNLLRKDLQLGKKELFVKSGVCFLKVPNIYLDSKEFEELVEEVIQADENKKECLLLEAEKLYRGDFLADYSNEDWATTIRENLKEKYSIILNEHAKLLMKVGEYFRAIEILSKAIKIDPYDEKAYFLLCLCYLNLGKPGRAEKFYKYAQERFLKDLGVNLSFPFDEVLNAREKKIYDLARKNVGAILVTEDVMNNYLKSSKDALVIDVKTNSLEHIYPEQIIKLFRGGDMICLKDSSLKILISNISKENSQKVVDRVSQRLKNILQHGKMSVQWEYLS